MCGISALVAPHPIALHDALARMTGAIGHRGPDDEGFASFAGGTLNRVWGGADTPEPVLGSDFPYAPAGRGAGEEPASVALGHRRLSILDLSPAGHQPMCYGDRRYWITYNGEVYNYEELRAELESLGHGFLSATDTEVVLAAYAEWGEACTQRFNGMWAFAILDLEAGTLFVSRDRFGIKPLYYWTSPDGVLAFASEIKQLTELEGWRPRANGRRLRDFLQWSTFDHTADTFFEGVRQVPGGHDLTIRVDAPRAPERARRWYRLEASTRDVCMEEAAGRVRELLSDSVRARLRADVKVGSCLSGGIDSSSIVCLVNRELARAGVSELQETVSSCSELPEFDERQFITAVLEQTKTRAHYVFPESDRLLDDLDRIVWHQDEPFGSTSIFAQWCVFDEARKNELTVMLDGQGADELFGGYRSAYASWIAELFVSGRWSALARNVRTAREVHGYKARRLLMMPARQLVPTGLRSGAGTWFETHFRPRWMSKGPAAGDGEPSRKPVTPGHSLADWSLDQLLYSNLPMLLHYEDRNSMAHSVESRVPYLDYRLVEYAMSLPGELKIQDATTKAVLRESMRGTIPDVIRERKDKMAFVTAEKVWFREQSQVFRPLLERSCELAPEVFDGKGVMDLFEKTASGKRHANSVLWRILCVGAWMERFGVEA